MDVQMLGATALLALVFIPLLHSLAKFTPVVPGVSVVVSNNLGNSQFCSSNKKLCH